VLGNYGDSHFTLRRIRKAKIPKEDRDLFERYGENVIGQVLASGLARGAGDLHRLYDQPAIKTHARDWLTERSDAHEQREQRLELLEWAIVVLIIVEIGLSLCRGFR
jgi:hypothetical protein